MSNERIDLTQFEKDEYDDRFYKVEACIGDYTRYMDEDENDIRLSKQLNLLPNLIDELKRCYEKLDEANKVEEALWNVLDNWEICWDDYSMHNLYNELDEKYAQDDDGRIVLKELYSYTEEDGWQLKEPTSE